MIGTVVNKMAALTQTSQILQPIVPRIIIEVRGSQNDAGLAHASHFFDIGPAGRAAAMIAPSLTGRVVPPPVRQNADDFAIWVPTALTGATGALEPHMVAELRLIDRIKPAHLSLDRHSTLLALVAYSLSRG